MGYRLLVALFVSVVKALGNYLFTKQNYTYRRNVK